MSNWEHVEVIEKRIKDKIEEFKTEKEKYTEGFYNGTINGLYQALSCLSDYMLYSKIEELKEELKELRKEYGLDDA